MKKIFILSLVIAFISIFFMSSVEVKAEPDCPLGYSLGEIQVQVGNNPSCAYIAVICYKCIPHGPNKIELEYTIISFKPKTSTCRKYMGEVLSAIEKALLDPTYIDNYLCYGTEAPPCSLGTTGLLISVKTKVCWHKYFDPEYGWDGVIAYEQCDDDPAVCKRIWKICWDEENQDFKYSFFESPTIVNGPPSCDIDEPDDPVVPYEYSDCFQAISPCNHPELYVY